MNVEEVQRRLWEQSIAHKQHRESSSPLFPVNPYELRVWNLMDLMHQPPMAAGGCGKSAGAIPSQSTGRRRRDGSRLCQRSRE
jgi:hypothetical protein